MQFFTTQNLWLNVIMFLKNKPLGTFRSWNIQMAANVSIKASWLELDRQFVPKNFSAKYRFPGDLPHNLNFDVLAIKL